MNIRFKIADTEYALTSDPYQIILSEVLVNKSGKKAGEERNKNNKYFQNEFKALAYLVDKQMLKSDAETFEELMEYRKRILADIEAIVEQYQLK